VLFRYYITIGHEQDVTNENVTIAFYKQGVNGRPVGYALALFPNLIFDSERAAQYAKIVALNKENSNIKIETLVDEVLMSPKLIIDKK
jgi:hypothetical protein